MSDSGTQQSSAGAGSNGLSKSVVLTVKLIVIAGVLVGLLWFIDEYVAGG